MRAHIPCIAPPPTHLHGVLQVFGGCTEAVEGEVLHNRGDPLTLIEGTPYKVSSTALARREHTQAIRSGA